jgi:hypothetical protein
MTERERNQQLRRARRLYCEARHQKRRIEPRIEKARRDVASYERLHARCMQLLHEIAVLENSTTTSKET